MKNVTQRGCPLNLIETRHIVRKPWQQLELRRFAQPPKMACLGISTERSRTANEAHRPRIYERSLAENPHLSQSAPPNGSSKTSIAGPLAQEMSGPDRHRRQTSAERIVVV